MHRIDTSTATEDNLYTDGDPAGGIPATVVDAAALNDMQENICLVIEAAGITLTKGDGTQLAEAILALIADNAPAPDQATEEEAGIARIATSEEVATGTNDDTFITPAKLAERLGAVAVEEYYIDGGALTPAITDGAALALAESATNKNTLNILSFQGSTKDTHGVFNFRAPSNWDGGTVKAKVLWHGAAGCSAGDDVEFYAAMAAVRDGDDLDPALGSAVTIHDTVNTGATKLNISPASAAITPAGTLAAGCLLLGRLSRNYDYGAQPLSEAAQVDGLVLQFGITGPVVAW